ncbi:MAG: GNAT family N-acetyltransferase [Actinomycetota bacterium]
MDPDLRWGRLDAAAVPAWAELANLLAEADGTEEFYDAADLAEELEESGFTPAADSWAVWHGDQLVAYGQLRVGHTLDAQGRVRATLGGGVAPDRRGRGIGRELADRMERRAVVLAAQRHPGAPSYWRADGGLEGSSARALWSRRGYEAVRFFNLLTRPLPGEPLAIPDVPARLVSPAEEQEESVRLSHNRAFADHWGTAPQAAGPWHDHWTARANRMDLSTLALAPDGEVLAYVLAGQWVDRELHVNLVGTVPGARGQGLAAACLARTLELGAASGDFDRADLDVDSESPTGATRLYERLGFTVKKTFAAMQRDSRSRVDEDAVNREVPDAHE